MLRGYAYAARRGRPGAPVVLDVTHHLVSAVGPLGEQDERLDHTAAPLVRRGDGRRLLDRGVLQARGLDLERAHPVAPRGAHVVRATLVPDVAVLVELGGVLGVEPLTAERLPCRLFVVP